MPEYTQELLEKLREHGFEITDFTTQINIPDSRYKSKIDPETGKNKLMMPEKLALAQLRRIDYEENLDDFLEFCNLVKNSENRTQTAYRIFSMNGKLDPITPYMEQGEFSITELSDLVENPSPNMMQRIDAYVGLREQGIEHEHAFSVIQGRLSDMEQRVEKYMAHVLDGVSQKEAKEIVCGKQKRSVRPSSLVLVYK